MFSYCITFEMISRDRTNNTANELDDELIRLRGVAMKYFLKIECFEDNIFCNLFCK